MEAGLLILEVDLPSEAVVASLESVTLVSESLFVAGAVESESLESIVVLGPEPVLVFSLPPDSVDRGPFTSVLDPPPELVARELLVPGSSELLVAVRVLSPDSVEMSVRDEAVLSAGSVETGPLMSVDDVVSVASVVPALVSESGKLTDVSVEAGPLISVLLEDVSGLVVIDVIERPCVFEEMSVVVEVVSPPPVSDDWDDSADSVMIGPFVFIGDDELPSVADSLLSRFEVVIPG